MVIVFNKLKALANPSKAQTLASFFKTGQGEYSEGEKFLGVTIPQIRKLAQEHLEIGFEEIKSLLKNSWHEARTLALEILVLKFKQANQQEQTKIYKFYIENIAYINNWDLVDLSAPKILGLYLFNRKREILYKLAKHESMWERRIAIVTTLSFVRNGDLDDCLNLTEIPQINLNHRLINL